MRIVGQIGLVLDTPDAVHAASCPWWKDQRARVCTCGKLVSVLVPNTITNAGLQYYAELAEIGYKGSGTVSESTFQGGLALSLCSAATPGASATWANITVLTSGEQNVDTGYPDTNDPDTDNPGTQTVRMLTWRATYGQGDGTGTVSHIALHGQGASGTDPLVSVAAVSPSVPKAAAQTGKGYVNHDFQDVP